MGHIPLNIDEVIGYALLETEHLSGFVARAPRFRTKLWEVGWEVTRLSGGLSDPPYGPDFERQPEDLVPHTGFASERPADPSGTHPSTPPNPLNNPSEGPEAVSQAVRLTFETSDFALIWFDEDGASWFAPVGALEDTHDGGVRVLWPVVRIERE